MNISQTNNIIFYNMSKDDKLNEIQKLRQIAPYPMQEMFILGYLTSGIPLAAVSEVKNLAKQVLSMQTDRLITNFNVLELMVMMKCEVFGQKDDKDKPNISSLVENLMTELVLDNTYLHNKHFQKAVRAQQVVSQNLQIECEICLTEINSSDLCFLSCGHMLHSGCFNEYAKEKIKSKNIPFNCPIEGCVNELTSAQLSEVLKKDIRLKYEEFVFQNYVDNNMVDTSWCPTPGCSAVFEFDEALTEYRCPACSKHYCLSCKCEYHTNLSCKEYKSMAGMNEEDKKFMMCVKGAKFKQCPNCKFWVEKNDGCDHMTCRCKYEFCYVCGGKYNRCKCQGFQNEEIQMMPNIEQALRPPVVQEIPQIRPRNMFIPRSISPIQRKQTSFFERKKPVFQNYATRPRRGPEYTEVSIKQPKFMRNRNVEYQKQEPKMIERSDSEDDQLVNKVKKDSLLMLSQNILTDIRSQIRKNSEEQSQVKRPKDEKLQSAFQLGLRLKSNAAQKDHQKRSVSPILQQKVKPMKNPFLLDTSNKKQNPFLLNNSKQSQNSQKLDNRLKFTLSKFNP